MMRLGSRIVAKGGVLVRSSRGRGEEGQSKTQIPHLPPPSPPPPPPPPPRAPPPLPLQATP
eukprot:9484412-Pyramimonas_sp.AAC.2